MIFLDANYFLRNIVQPDNPENRARHDLAAAVFAAAARGETEITTSESVLAEVAYVLASPRQYGLSAAEIAARLKPILALRAFKHPHKRRYLRALDIWMSYPRLGFEDALTVAELEETGLPLATFDRDLDDIPGIRRWVPEP